MANNPGDIIGVFLGLESATYEYIANIIIPYNEHVLPKIGEFLLVDSLDEYVITRIMEYIPKGELTTFMGEKWLADVTEYANQIGQDIKEKKVSYRVKLKLLGRLQKNNDEFRPGILKIPHITSCIYRPRQDIVQNICNKALIQQEMGIKLGTFWLDENIDIHFNIEQMVGKRSFIFARAGYGKSNLMKILASNWKADFGSLFIFDPEGEYAITDSKGRPGILDHIPAILITNRKKLEQQLSTNLYTNLKFNLKDFNPRFIIPLIIQEEKHEMVFFRKLMSLSREKWGTLVDLIYKDNYGVEGLQITALIKGKLDPESMKEDESVVPILNNLVSPIQNLHDPNSRLMDILKLSAKNHYPVIIDISLLNSQTALQLTSIIVRSFFSENQNAFIGGKEGDELYKIVFVMEEAQSVLGPKGGNSTFIELAKEGRKYNLGGIFITQQPGSIAPDILSQGDNFFIFHMLSKGDLRALQNANAHYSEDIMTQILNEPIPGKTYMWSSPQPFVIPMSISNFEKVEYKNQAPTIQKEHNLLAEIFSTVSYEDNLQNNLIETLINIAANRSIDLITGNISDTDRKTLSVQLYNKLNADQYHLLEKEDKIQIRISDKKPFAIKFLYLDYLIQQVAEKLKLSKISDEKNSN